MRLTGMASGMDTESMVQQLMKVERMKVDRYEQRKQVSLWQQDSYTKMNKAMSNFIVKTKTDFGLGKRYQLFDRASVQKLDYTKKTVSSNESVVSVKTSGKAAVGDFEMEVKELSKLDKFTTGKIEGDITLNAGEEIKINDVVVYKAKNDETLSGESLNRKINEGIKAIKDKHSKYLAPKAGEPAPTDEEKEVLRKEKELIKSEFSSFYDAGTKRIYMQSTHNDGGLKVDIPGLSSSGELTFKDGKTYLGSNIVDANSDAYKNYSIIEDGNHGKILINGIELEAVDNKVTFNNVEITLKAKGTSTISTKTDVASIFDKVKSFVDEYNTMLDLMYESVNQKKYPGFHPLSKEEKEAMKEKDIELWEEKAKSGMLNRDETLNRIMINARRDLYEAIEIGDKKVNISELGITTDKFARGSAGGKLVIDEEKLRKAIEDDPEFVMEALFKNDGVRTDKEKNTKRDPKNQGIFTRIYDAFAQGIEDVVWKSGLGEDRQLLDKIDDSIGRNFVIKGSQSDISKLLDEMDKKIDRLNIMLDKKENSYYKKFTAMEKYIHQMNSQSGWIGQQMM